jgi:ABC-type branched-chain amino acid transport systems, ATPase component
MSLLSLQNITKRFGGLTAVDQLSIEIEKGEIFSIIGPNGAGKSTVFNCINGLYTPEEGDIIYEGQHIKGLRPDQIAKLGIARTFQNLELFANMTTLDNIMLGRHMAMRASIFSIAALSFKRSRAAKEEMDHRKKVEEIIDFLDLEAVRFAHVSHLPYGQQKLVELGRALAQSPDLLLLDEPAAGLTQEEKEAMIYWIQDIRDQLGITILMIEHNMQMVKHISDRISAINFGKRLITGTPAEVLEHPEVIKAYLGEEVSTNDTNHG